MAVTAYQRLRMFWGALDYTLQGPQTPGYSSTQIVTGGPSATVGSGVGVRRASIQIDRSAQNALLDPAYIHFDWLNLTSGTPDDTWTTSDFTTMEAIIATAMTTYRGFMPTSWTWTQVAWYRVGTGVTKPNPAERILINATPPPGTGASIDWPNQVAYSITFRTGVRKSWGRTYLPVVGATLPDGTIGTSVVDSICTATHTMVTSAASSDFHLVVVSKPLSSSLNVEKIQVDNVPDVIRRRRLKKKTYAKVLP